MNRHLLRSACLATFLSACTLVHAETSPTALTESLNKLALSYDVRVREATENLVATRERIQKEQAPLVARINQLEAEILQLEAEVQQLETFKEKQGTLKKETAKDGDLLRKNLAYMASTATDHLKLLEQQLRPGESEERQTHLRKTALNLESASKDSNPEVVVEAFRESFSLLKTNLGFHFTQGLAASSEKGEVTAGHFVIFGPDSLFLSDKGDLAGYAFLREGAPVPLVTQGSAALAAGLKSLVDTGEGRLAVDAAGGKALKLEHLSGSFWTHLHKGGAVAYAILAVGGLSLSLILWKLLDLGKLAIGDPRRFTPVARLLADSKWEEARKLAAALPPQARQLADIALRNPQQDDALVEEEFDALLHGFKLHYERRLPLLAVIATASPLMGLLGTVMGMVKTFALITIFGTGNATKLSSGISEVLVTTELGLAVAIPTLVMHGFIAHRLQKKLGALERFAFELGLARKAARSRAVETSGT